jgi:hypothetical protein
MLDKISRWRRNHYLALILTFSLRRRDSTLTFMDLRKDFSTDSGSRILTGGMGKSPLLWGEGWVRES